MWDMTLKGLLELTIPDRSVLRRARANEGQGEGTETVPPSRPLSLLHTLYVSKACTLTQAGFSVWDMTFKEAMKKVKPEEATLEVSAHFKTVLPGTLHRLRPK